MAIITRRPDDTVPLNESWRYALSPGGASQQVVEIVRIEDGIVYVQGVGSTTAEWSVPTWRFDDLVAEWYEGGYGILTEDGEFFLATEDLEGALGA